MSGTSLISSWGFQCRPIYKAPFFRLLGQCIQEFLIVMSGHVSFQCIFLKWPPTVSQQPISSECPSFNFKIDYCVAYIWSRRLVFICINNRLILNFIFSDCGYFSLIASHLHWWVQAQTRQLICKAPALWPLRLPGALGCLPFQFHSPFPVCPRPLSLLRCGQTQTRRDVPHITPW